MGKSAPLGPAWRRVKAKEETTQLTTKTNNNDTHNMTGIHKIATATATVVTAMVVARVIVADTGKKCDLLC